MHGLTVRNVLSIALCILSAIARHDNRPMSSQRLLKTERPYIEDVLEKYADLPDITILALGSSYWGPPAEALQKIAADISDPGQRAISRYGNLLGLPSLQNAISSHLQSRGIDMEGLEVAISAGANQAFTNAALGVCDEGDNAIILAPYYFSHQMGLQIAGANISICPFDPVTLSPQWDTFEHMVNKLQPKMVSHHSCASYRPI